MAGRSGDPSSSAGPPQAFTTHHHRKEPAMAAALTPLLTSEGTPESTYRDNPDLSAYDTTDALGSAIASTLEEGWPPLAVIDLDTGEEMEYAVRVEFGGAPFTPTAEATE
jgi:hypothetical protein